jgi:hypothetical protein
VLAVLGSTWTLGLLAAVATWNVVFLLPLPGLDESTAAGVYIAANRGMHFGTQVVTVFGPLGFLTHPWLWYSNLGVIAFLYQAVLHIALCVSLIWALRRTLHPIVTLVVTFFVLITAPYLDVPVVLTAIWCLASLSPTTPRFRWLVLFGGATLAAIEILRYLRDGPVILLVCAITLVADKRWRREFRSSSASPRVSSSYSGSPLAKRSATFRISSPILCTR